MRFLLVAALLLPTLTLQAETPPVIRHSPEFVLRYNDGHQTLLSSYRGKVIALLFVHTTCPHCQHISQVFTEIQKEYGPRGFQALDAAFNNEANQYVPDFIKNFGIGYPVGLRTPPRSAGLSEVLLHPALRCSADGLDRQEIRYPFANQPDGRGQQPVHRRAIGAT